MGLKAEERGPQLPSASAAASSEGPRAAAPGKKGAGAAEAEADGCCCAAAKPSAQCRPQAMGLPGSAQGTKPAGGGASGAHCCAPPPKGRPRPERGVPGAELCREAGKVPWEPQPSSLSLPLSVERECSEWCRSNTDMPRSGLAGSEAGRLGAALGAAGALAGLQVAAGAARHA